MTLALDTNRLSDLFRGEADVVERLEAEDDAIVLPFAVVAEYLFGIEVGTRGRKSRELLDAFLLRDAVIRFADTETLGHYARIYAHLRRAGTPIPTNDLWIAAVCVQHNLALYTRDGHFKEVPGLRTL